MSATSHSPMADLVPGCAACDEIIDFRRSHPSLTLHIYEPTKFVITPDSHKRHPHVKRPRNRVAVPVPVDATGRVCVCGYTFTTADGSDHIAEDHEDRTRENARRAAEHIGPYDEPPYGWTELDNPTLERTP